MNKTTEERAKGYDKEIHHLAMDVLRKEWEYLYVGGSYPARPYPTNYNMALSLWVRGYKEALAALIAVPVQSDEEDDLWMELIKEVELNEFRSTKYKETIDKLKSQYKLTKK